MAAQDLATIQAFMASLRKKSPPYSCYICQKMYRSFSGMEYHLKEVGHDENGKERSKIVSARPMNNTPKKALGSSRPKSRKSGGLKSSCASSPAPGKKETLTYSEAQRLVQVDVGGSLCRVSMNHGLGVVVRNEPEPVEETDSVKIEDVGQGETCPASNLSENSLNDTIHKSLDTGADEQRDSVHQQTGELSDVLSGTPGKHSESPEGCRKMPKRSCAKTKNTGKTDIIRSTPDVKKKQRRTVSSGACTSALPVAVVRIIEPPCTNSSLEEKSAYFRFMEKSTEELDEAVEYDMDEDDSEWLDGINAKRKRDGMSAVSKETFELLMDRLEKESFFESRRDGTHNGLDPTLDEDAVCCICNDGEAQNSNAILFCDMCNLAVHQECYGVPFIPEGQWLCRRCLNSPSCAVDCVLCPNKGGAFKQTDTGQWAHVVCALWIPEVQFANAVFLEPIDSINEIPGARWRLTCYICHRRGGACIQCVNRNCYTAFHPTCAQHAGLYMNMEMTKKADGDKLVPGIRKVVYCDAHSPQSGEEPSEDLSCGLTVGKAIVGKATPRAPPSDLLKKKLQAERRLSALAAAPIVNIPFVTDQKLADIASLVSMPKKAVFLQQLRSFWALKRQSRSGVPLLRRLQASHQSQKSGLETETVAALKEQLVHWHRLRHDLERSRMLIELIHKREKLKREDLRIHQHMTDLQLQPLTVLLRRTLDQLQQKDVVKIFAEPVSVEEVPDYLDIIEHPMDFSTMRTKLEQHEYSSVVSFIEDFQLIYRNCMTYNAKETVYYRAAVRLRDSGTPLLRFARKQAELAGIDPETGMHVEPDLDPEQLQLRLCEDLTLAEQLEELRIEHDEVKASSSPGKTARLRGIRKQMTNIRNQMRKEIVEKKIEAGVMTAAEGAVDLSTQTSPSAKLKPQKRRRGPGGRGYKRARTSILPAQVNDTTTAESCTDQEETEDDMSLSLSLQGSNDSASKVRTPDSSSRNGLLGAGDSGMRPQRNRKPSERMRETDDFTLRCATVTRTSSQDVSSELPASPTSLSTGVPGSNQLSPADHPQTGRGAVGLLQLPSVEEAASVTCESVSGRAARPVVSLSRLRTSPTTSSSSIGVPSTASTMVSMDSSSTLDVDAIENGHTPAAAGAPVLSTSLLMDSPAARKRRKPGRPPNSARHSSTASMLSSATSTGGDDVFRFANGDASLPGGGSGAALPMDGTDGDNVGPNMPCAVTPTDSMLDTRLKPLDLVWAKTRGYPSYPALIIDPAMTDDEANIGGQFLPRPPPAVLDLRAAEDDNLVLFFDARRTWQWLPREKLAPLGCNDTLDFAKLAEGRKFSIRRSVSKAYDRALMHRLRSGGDAPIVEEEEDEEEEIQPDL